MKAEVLTFPGLFGNSWQLSGAVAVAGFARAQLLHCRRSIMTWVLLFVSLECYFLILKDALTSKLFKVDTGMANTRLIFVICSFSWFSWKQSPLCGCPESRRNQGKWCCSCTIRPLCPLGTNAHSCQRVCSKLRCVDTIVGRLYGCLWVWCVWPNPISSAVPGESQPMEGSGAAEHAPAANQTNTDPAAAAEPEVG